MCNPDTIQKFLADLSVNIGKLCEVQSIELENQVRKCAAEYCSNIDADILRFVLYSSSEAYFRALKTFEEAIRATLIDDDGDQV